MRVLTTAFGALALSAAAALADPVVGTWQTAADDNGNFGHIEVAPCGDKICGVLVRSYNSAGAPIESANTGRKIIWDMEPRGDGRYSGGKIYAPDRDKTYSSKMTLTGDRLAVEGCIMMICRDGGTWMRVK